MSYASDDLTPLLLAAPGPGVGFRQGVVTAWDPVTAENTVDVGGATLTDLPCLNTSEALLMQAGDVVGILTAGPSWFVLGRITVPGQLTVPVFGAGLVSAGVVGNIAVPGGGYAANGGPSVTTTVLGSGRVLATVGATMDCDVGEAVAVAVFGSGPGGASFGPASPPLQLANLLTSGTLGGTINASASAQTEITGLTPGEWTFELRYWKWAGTGNPNVSARHLTIAPF